MVDFGSRLRDLRKKHNMTQLALARKLQVTKSVISAYENGLRLPSFDVLLEIARTFGVSTDYLLGNDCTKSKSLDLSGLSDREIEAIKTIVNSIRSTRAEVDR